MMSQFHNFGQNYQSQLQQIKSWSIKQQKQQVASDINEHNYFPFQAFYFRFPKGQLPSDQISSVMSNILYNVHWKEAINQLLQNLQEEYEPLQENLSEKGLKYQRKDQEWYRFYAHLYVKYIHCYKILQDAYDQLIQPQKRVLLKQMLQSVMLRIVEVKSNLIKYNTSTNIIRSQYINLDQILLEMRVRPIEIQMHIPRYFREDTNVDKQKRNQIVDKFLLDLKQTNLPQQEVIEQRSALDTNIQTAIRIIQKTERGRQGIVRALKATYYKKKQQKKNEKKKQKPVTDIDVDDAFLQKQEQVTSIQKTIRGFLARKKVQKIRSLELSFLGMIKKPQDINDPTTQLYKATKKREQLRKLQKKEEKQYKNTINQLKDQLLQNWQQPLKQKMLKDRHLWIAEYMEKYQFSKIPDSSKQFYEKDKVKMPLTPQEQEQKDKQDELKKKNKKKGKKKKVLSQRQLWEKDNPKNGPTETVLKLQEQIQNHTKKWKEGGSATEGLDLGKIKQTVLPEVQDQIKNLVDDMIELQLANLRIKFKKKKGKKSKKKKKKKKKKKALKVPGWKQISKIPPLDQIGHLVDYGVLKKLMPAKMKDLIGEPNLLRSKEQKVSQLMPDPSMFDIRQILVQMIGIPLGSQYIKSKIDKIHYFLFFGPHGSGKTLAIRALAHQCDALVLELSPSTLQPKLNDKKQLNKMLAMTFNVAKTFPPAIIYMDEVENIFKAKKKKKKGAGGAAGPNFTKLRKPLTKYKKKVLKKQDRVAVIACTNRPWQINKKFIKAFTQKKFYFPFPNYGTRKALFQHFLQKKGIQLPDNFPVTTIAHATEGYTGGNFKQTINKVLTQRRLMQLHDKKNIRPLQVNEFIGPLSNQSSTYIEQYQKFKEFNDDVTGLKARRQKRNKPQEKS